MLQVCHTNEYSVHLVSHLCSFILFRDFSFSSCCHWKFHLNRRKWGRGRDTGTDSQVTFAANYVKRFSRANFSIASPSWFPSYLPPLPHCQPFQLSVSQSLCQCLAGDIKNVGACVSFGTFACCFCNKVHWKLFLLFIKIVFRALLKTKRRQQKRVQGAGCTDSTCCDLPGQLYCNVHTLRERNERVIGCWKIVGRFSCMTYEFNLLIFLNENYHNNVKLGIRVQ